jgi:sarcosine oxidase subunit beta
MHEIAIVGAGLVGCLTALRLADAGHRCVIVDQGNGLNTASHASAGGIYLQLPPHRDTVDRIERRGTALAPLMRESLPAWRRLANRLPGIPLRLTGGLIVGFDDGEMSALRSKHAVERSLGLVSELLTGADIRRMSPDFSPDIAGGCFAPDEGHCEPGPLMLQVRDELRRLGVPIRTHCRVERLDRQASGTTLHFGDGSSIGADRVVLATGGSTDSILDRLRVPHAIDSFPIQMLSVRSKPLCIPVLTRAVGLKLSLKRTGGGHVWIGGGWRAAGYDHTTQATVISAARERSNLAAAVKVMPSLDSATVDGRWGGWVAWTRDGLPIIGSCPGRVDTVLACGGNGFSLAPLYAELLSALATGSTTALDLSPFAVDRFGHGAAGAGNSIDVAPD